MLLSFKISLAIIFSMFGGKDNVYANTMVVVDTTEEWVICVDFCGNEWAFENSAEDWMVGDIASVVMYDNCTDIIYDDVILSAKYSGWIKGNWGYDSDSGTCIVSFEE